MGTKLNPGEYDCYKNALPDEPIFVLLGRDPQAPLLTFMWGAQRMLAVSRDEQPMSDIDVAVEAIECATAMAKWREANNGKWRAKPEPEISDKVAPCASNPNDAEMKLQHMIQIMSNSATFHAACALDAELYRAFRLAKGVKAG